ncbi:MAG: hypothetical protein HUJ31_04615, partial [Pseudomonadales bacterium]|nr:hypothetical protein [Pseudomonadales bacterium]
RNGELIERLDFAADRSGQTVRVSMSSDSHPWHDQRDLPRNGREWIGYLRVRDGDIRRAMAPGFDNSRRQAIALNPAEDNRLDFISWTRGNTTSFMVEIARDETSPTTLELHLKSGFEDVDQIPRARSPQPIPAIRQQVELDDLRFGSVIRSFNVEGYTDQVTFDLVQPDLPVRQSFEFVDSREPGSVDYYYLKIRQIDDHVLWSSPVWVGGFDIR